MGVGPVGVVFPLFLLIDNGPTVARPEWHADADLLPCPHAASCFSNASTRRDERDAGKGQLGLIETGKIPTIPNLTAYVDDATTFILRRAYAPPLHHCDRHNVEPGDERVEVLA